MKSPERVFREDLYYLTEKESFNFYYRDILLFKNNSKFPFITVTESAGNIEKITPLFNCRIVRLRENTYSVVFNHKNAEVSCEISEASGRISFKIEGKSDYNKIKLAFAKNARVIRGFGSNEILDFSGMRIGNGKVKNKDFENGILEKILCFEVSGLYRFENENIEEWEVYAEKNINLTVSGRNVNFYLDTNLDDAKLEEKKPIYLLKTDNMKIEYLVEAKKKYNLDGIIPNFDLTQPKKLLVKQVILARNNLKLFYNAQMEFSENSFFNEAFTADCKERIDGKKWFKVFKREKEIKYIANASGADMKRQTTNALRAILDVNADGIMLNSGSNVTETLMSVYLRAANEIKNEYGLEKSIIYDKLCYYRENGCYLIKNAQGMNRVNIIKSLKVSGVNKVAVEYDEEATDNAEKYADFVIIYDKK
jgi:hypothetical protein